MNRHERELHARLSADEPQDELAALHGSATAIIKRLRQAMVEQDLIDSGDTARVVLASGHLRVTIEHGPLIAAENMTQQVISQASAPH